MTTAAGAELLDGETRFDYDAARAFAGAVLECHGVPPQDAGIVAESLLDADLSGIRTHGLRLLPSYLDRLRAGAINATPEITVEQRAGAVISVDGDDGFGQVVIQHALTAAMSIARAQGVALTTVHGSNHLGALGYPARLAAEAGMFAFLGQNTRTNTLLPGGDRAGVGNNPFAFALPSGEADPVVLDISCSAISRNSIYRARELGERLPEGVATDRDGALTTDPLAAMEGSLLAFGGHKGAGLAIVVGALAGVFSGAKYGAQIPAPTDYSTERDIGHFLLLIDTSFLGDADENMARMRTYLADITASGEGVRYPGQRSGSSRRRALDEGVTLPTTVLERLRQEASDAGHDLELPGALT